MRTRALLGLLLLTGCADKSAPARDDGRSLDAEAATPIDQGDRDDAGTTAAASSEDASDADASTVQPSTSPDASTAASDASSAASNDASASDPASDADRDAGGQPTPSDSATYRTERWVGGLDHLVIFKRDEARGYCVIVRLSSPASPTNADVQLPARWQLGPVQAIDAVSCEPPSSTQGPPATRTSLSAQGRIAWRKLDAHGQPCSVDVDLSLSFDSVGHIPSSDRVLVEDLAVQCD